MLPNLGKQYTHVHPLKFGTFSNSFRSTVFQSAPGAFQLEAFELRPKLNFGKRLLFLGRENVRVIQ